MTAHADEPAPPGPDSDPDRTLLAREAAAAPPSLQASSNVLPEGTQLGEFSVTGVIGEGGFGIVYRAHDRALQRTVAVKEYMPSALAARLADTRVVVKSEQHRETFEVGLKSFINEARLLAQFDHPALVKVFRFWAANGTAYMAMPLYEGGTLKQALKGMTAPPDEAWLRKLLVPLLDAIELLHNADCLHRDIAPDNILMGPGGTPDTPRPVLLDFGAARRVIGGQTQALTVILKPGYAPIEQYDEIPGMKQGPWTDLYALGAVMHFAITGKPPPPSVGRLVHDAWVPLSSAAAGRYGSRFLAAIDAALAARPEDRPRSVAQWRTLLADAPAGAAVQSGAPTAAPKHRATQSADAATMSRSQPRTQPPAEPGTTAHAPSAPTAVPRAARPTRWLRAITAGAAVGLLIVAAGWGLLSWQARQGEQRLVLKSPQPRTDRPATAPARTEAAANPTAPAASTPAPDATVEVDAGTAPGSGVATPTASTGASTGANTGVNAPAAAETSARSRREPAADVNRRPPPPTTTTQRPAPSASPPPTAVVAAAPTWIDVSLREGRDCLAARQYACTIARAEAVLKAEPAHATALALLRDGRAGQEAALGGDWKMR